VTSPTTGESPGQKERHRLNLPVRPGSFVGRAAEVAKVTDLLCSDDVRLLTMTGPGGIGKSRLAAAVVTSIESRFADGAAHVPLAPVGDAGLVPSAIARSLDVTESAERTVVENLTEFLKARELLLLLDNFEHVVSAGLALTQLLASCPRIKILVTSRALLFVRGEQEFEVPPLDVPSLDDARDDGVVHSEYESVRLFVERAREVDAQFGLTDENAHVVAEICTRLDGLPLAIELAAARIKTISAEEILARITNRLDLLTEGPADLPERQRTLRAAIDWDYELLSEAEQRIFRRLGVFSGGFSIPAAEAIIGTDEYPGAYILDTIESLEAKSLLEAEGNAEPVDRYSMLRTLREYAFDKLASSDETSVVVDRHTAFFTELAEEAAPHLQQADQVEWLAVLEREHDNMRVALRWLADKGDAESELRLAAALAHFWEFRAHLSEGQQRLEEALARGEEASAPLRAVCLDLAGRLARGQGEFKRARQLAETSIRLFRELGDTNGLAGALKGLGIIAAERGDLASARSLYEESLALKREVGDPRGIAEALNNLGVVSHGEGDLETAIEYYDQALTYFGEAGDKQAMARILMNLGEAKMEQGLYPAAKGFIRGSLVLCQEVDSHWDIADLLELMASTIGATGLAEDGAKLFGAAAALRDLLGTPLPPSEVAAYADRVSTVKARMKEEEFETAWKEGRAMSVDQAVAFALTM
jgi:predicted ATPase